jgi:hypothetical protein
MFFNSIILPAQNPVNYREGRGDFMKFRLIVSLLFVAMLMAMVAIAQSNLVPFAAERPISRLPPNGDDPRLDRYRCGDYLLFDAFSKGVEPHGPRISYTAEILPRDPANPALLFIFLKDKFVFLPADSKKPPTAQLTITEGSVSKVTIRMPQKEIDMIKACIQ